MIYRSIREDRRNSGKVVESAAGGRWEMDKYQMVLPESLSPGQWQCAVHVS